VFREALRLYPPVPMMVREAARAETFRNRSRCPVGAQVVISPWHLHRHTRLWENADGFDPGRWGTENGKVPVSGRPSSRFPAVRGPVPVPVSR
jgi:cytochrome P450